MFWNNFWLFSYRFPSNSCCFPNCRRSYLVASDQLHQTHHVVHQIHHPDFDLRPQQANRAYPVSTHLRLPPEDVFHTRSDFGFGAIGNFLYLGQRVAPAAFFTYLARDVLLCQRSFPFY